MAKKKKLYGKDAIMGRLELLLDKVDELNTISPLTEINSIVEEIEYIKKRVGEELANNDEFDHFTNEELQEEYEFRSLNIRATNSAVDDWKYELWEEHQHKFTLPEIETFLTSKNN